MATNGESSSTATPRLRFPKFRKATGWPLKKVGDVLEEVERPIEMDDDATYALVTVKRRYCGVVAREQLTGRAIKVKSQFIVKTDDFLISNRQIVHNACGVVPADLDGSIVSNEYSVLRARDNANVRFFEYFAQQPAVSESFLSSSVGIVIEKMLFKLQTWLRFEFPFPDIAEQQTIADCLTSLDELIVAQGRQVAALAAYKWALMQQLFPREGETRPRLRFPDFRDAPEWEERPLKSLADYENGKAYEQDVVEDGRFVVVNSRFISTDGEVRKYTNAQYCTASRGDVLMVLSDLPNGKALAKCFLVDLDERYAVNQRVARLKPTNVESAFLYYRLNRSPRLLIFDDGLSQTHLSKGSVQDCLLGVPREQAEQQRIAACLSALDTQISAASEKLEALNIHKKGLMQQLFPRLEDCS